MLTCVLSSFWDKLSSMLCDIQILSRLWEQTDVYYYSMQSDSDVLGVLLIRDLCSVRRLSEWVASLLFSPFLTLTLTAVMIFSNYSSLLIK